MSDDYLWDGTGEPDPDVKHLEETLRPLRYGGSPPELPRRRRWLLPVTLAAAGLLIGAVLNLQSQDSGAGFIVEALRGSAAISRLDVGQILETDGDSRVRVLIADIGRVDVDPGSRVRLVNTGDDEHRLALDHGRLEALVYAPPRLFVVETPAADAVDLGCAYELEVDEGGDGHLRVTSGWVALEGAGKESRVPRGASCATSRAEGPGTPRFDDASAAFASALEKLDAGDEGALDVVLTEARERDTLTLWHLLHRVSEPDRGRVYDRLSALASPPPGVSRRSCVALDSGTVEAWWDSIQRVW